MIRIIAALSMAVYFLSMEAAHAQTLRERLKGFVAGAHQGGIFGFDPNTLHRFEKARRSGVQIIETDLRLTKDGKVIIFHDEKLSPSTFCKGRIEDKTLEEIKKCKILTGHEIPTFEEVLDWAHGRVVINAEFKVREVIEPAIELVQRRLAYDWVFFQTKGDPVRYERARAFDRRVALLFAPKSLEALDWALGLNDDDLVVIELHAGLETPQVIDRIHQHGKLALDDSWRFVWHKEVLRAACREVFALGIDIAISNNPRSCFKQSVKANRSHSQELAEAEQLPVLENGTEY